MAKNKKRKKNTPSKKDPILQKISFSNNKKKAIVCTIKKVFVLIGIPPETFDRFTKKQRDQLTNQLCGPPRIVLDKDSTMPSMFLKDIQNLLYSELNRRYVGDPEINLSIYEYMSVGMSFVSIIRILQPLPSFASNYDLIEEIRQAIEKCDEIDEYIATIDLLMKYAVQFYTKINFRFYTFDIQWKEISSRLEIVYYITIHSYEAVRKYFCPFGELRSAYKLGYAEVDSKIPKWVTVSHDVVVPGSCSKTPLTVYVQPHTLVRMRERLDLFENTICIGSLLISLKFANLVKAVNGQLLIPFFCVNKADQTTTSLLGYLPFVVEGGSLFLLSFLPLTTPICPEGNKLTKILGITKEESAYLGMDKLSFFYSTDFSEVPHLKQALIDAGIWHLTTLDYINDEDLPKVKRSETLIKFFAKKMEE